MSLLNLFRSNKKTSAATAKERLQIIISHQRNAESLTSPDYLPALQNEILDVIAKYVEINREAVKIDLAKSGDRSVLELNIALPK